MSSKENNFLDGWVLADGREITSEENPVLHNLLARLSLQEMIRIIESERGLNSNE